MIDYNDDYGIHTNYNNKNKSENKISAMMLNEIIKKKITVPNPISLTRMSSEYTSLVDDDDDDDDDDNYNNNNDDNNNNCNNFTISINNNNEVVRNDDPLMLTLLGTEEQNNDLIQHNHYSGDNNVEVSTTKLTKMYRKITRYCGLIGFLPFLVILSIYSLAVIRFVVLYIFIKPKKNENYDKNLQQIKHCTIDDYNSYNATNENTHRRIILFGDSLIGKPTLYYNLNQQLQVKINNYFHPYQQFEVISSGVDSDTIAKLKDRMYYDCIYCRPEAVIMYWDSELTNLPKSYLSSQEGIDTYTNNLIDVITALKSSVKYVAVSGPNLLGELREGHNSYDKYLNMYRQINRDVSLSYNIPYIDIRQAFLDADRLKGWDQSSGYLTLDGEHPSEAGSKIEVNVFYDQLVMWYGNGSYSVG
jgi:hypothetical protein